MKTSSKIYVAGHRGMAGSAILKKLEKAGYNNFILRTHKELDLTVQKDVKIFFAEEQPEYVFLAAAKVGGINANNTYKADFIYQNTIIASNIIDAAYSNNVKKLLFLGSSCIYPKLAPQPIKEEYLLTSELEPTNEAYAIAKIVGLKMCAAYNEQYGTDFISVMPTNLYGPGDNYNPENSHVFAALIKKIHDAVQNGDTTVSIWGSGTPRREFLYSEDLADACIFIMENYSHKKTGECLNIGTGKDLTIKELAETIAKVADFTGKLVFDTSKPDGTPQKLLDISKISTLGWKPKTSLLEGIKKTYQNYKKQQKQNILLLREKSS
ncbi:MAG: GDP-L-fucose synthase [Verrucomicrobiota bacterium]|nr:GDP-L-fucose synthase [Verrucomicrobiota bacterium]